MDAVGVDIWCSTYSLADGVVGKGGEGVGRVVGKGWDGMRNVKVMRERVLRVCSWMELVRSDEVEDRKERGETGPDERELDKVADERVQSQQNRTVITL
jgi:hypothetical protein